MTARARTTSAPAKSPRLKAVPSAPEVLGLFAEPAPAPAPVEPTPPPAWAVEAATAPPTVLAPPRDFEAAQERVRLGEHLVIRQRVADGHLYQAFERADAFFYNVTLDALTWGRIDTRRDATPDPADDLRAAFERQFEREAEARAVIRALCPETIIHPGELAPAGCGIYERPDGILITSDPARRYAARRPA